LRGANRSLRRGTGVSPWNKRVVIGPWEFFFLVQIGILILVGEGSVSYCSGSDSLP
jgi:hypothetical protein